MENLDRPAKLKEFAETCANGAAFVLNPLSTDASSRKYYRMRFNDGGSAVIMDDEGCRCRTREFVELSAFLRARGVYVPEVKSKDFGNGFLLLEDLGDDTVTKLLTDNNEMRLYRMAGRAAAKVAAVRERPQCVNELSRRRILDDLRLFTDWYFRWPPDSRCPNGPPRNFSPLPAGWRNWPTGYRTGWCCGTITSTTSCCRRTRKNARSSIFRTPCGDRSLTTS